MPTGIHTGHGTQDARTWHFSLPEHASPVPSMPSHTYYLRRHAHDVDTATHFSNFPSSILSMRLRSSSVIRAQLLRLYSIALPACTEQKTLSSTGSMLEHRPKANVNDTCKLAPCDSPRIPTQKRADFLRCAPWSSLHVSRLSETVPQVTFNRELQ